MSMLLYEMGAIHMRKTLLAGILALLMCSFSVILWASFDSIDDFKRAAENADTIVESDGFILDKDIKGDVYIRGVSGVLKAHIQGNVYLENSKLELQDQAKITGRIYIHKSHFISPISDISSDWGMIEGYSSDGIRTRKSLLQTVEGADRHDFQHIFY